jgi:hypothetical protein
VELSVISFNCGSIRTVRFNRIILECDFLEYPAVPTEQIGERFQVLTAAIINMTFF